MKQRPVYSVISCWLTIFLRWFGWNLIDGSEFWLLVGTSHMKQRVERDRRRPVNQRPGGGVWYSSHLQHGHPPFRELLKDLNKDVTEPDVCFSILYRECVQDDSQGSKSEDYQLGGCWRWWRAEIEVGTSFKVMWPVQSHKHGPPLRKVRG